MTKPSLLRRAFLGGLAGLAAGPALAQGVRRVTIEILEWGDARRSYAMLKPRKKHAHVKRMVRQLEERHEL